jgi:prominin 1
MLSLSLLPLLLVVAPSSAQENQPLVCHQVSRVTRLPDGNLTYSALPPTDPPDTQEYSPRGLEGWYNLARGFVNTVQPENLPYDVIESTIRESNIECTSEQELAGSCNSNTETNAEATLKEFGQWWAPLIAVTVIGGVMAFIFGLVGAIFWCCRCCGQCGGSRSMTEPRDKCMFGITIALLLVTLLLLVGVVLSFYSNDQSFHSINSLQDTLNDIVDTGVGYVDAFLDDADALFCQFVQVTDIALDETSVISGSLNELIDSVAENVSNVLQELQSLSTGINETSNILMDVSTTTQQLQSNGDMLTTSLNSISMDVDSLRSTCVSSSIPDCSTIIPPSTMFEAGVDFNNLPDVSGQLTDVQDALDGINLQGSIDQGNAEFERLTEQIQSEVSSHLGILDDDSDSSVLSALTDANETLFETRDSVVGDIREVINSDYNIDDCPAFNDLVGGTAEDVTVDVGFIQQCYINQFFEEIKKYDVYRYAFGVIICCLALLTVVLTLVGITLGVVGWKKDRSPDSRTRVSHCGGIILLVNIGLAFLFGVVLLLLASLAFFLGSNMQKICQAIEPPEYEFFARVLDNRELWGRSLVGDAVLGQGNNLSISAALRACEADDALYTAFNLSRRFDVRSEVLNTTGVFDELAQQLDDTVDSFDYSTDSFLDDETRAALNDFTSASVDTINITAFRDTLSASILAFDLNATITSLEQVRDMFGTLATETQDIIDKLENIRDVLIPAIETNVATLEMQVDQLSSHIDNVVVQTNVVVKSIDSLVLYLTGGELGQNISGIAMTTLENLEGYINSFLNHIAEAAEMEVGQCRPVVTIYSSAYSVICNEAVDGLNGYWWSLGFCAAVFIPLIVLAVIASTHYLRQKKPNDDDYPDFPLKAR